MNAAVEAVNAPLKLNLGSGPNKMEGYVNVDSIKFPNVDVVTNLTKKWPWKNDTVSEVHCSHTLEHFERLERIHFVNELYRVLIPGGKCTIIVPYWASNRAYGDMSHCWPPVSEMWFSYLDRTWRKRDAPHDDIEFNPKGYDCNFVATWGYSIHQSLLTRNSEYQQHALSFWKEAAQDLHATLVKA